MFNWICPQCGRECPPSYTECPDCSARAKNQEAVPVASAPEPEPSPPPEPQAPPAQSKFRLPGWLLSVVFALAFVAAGLGAYFGFEHFRANKVAAPAAIVPETPTLPAPVSAKSHPLAKYIEITGIRLTEDSAKKTQVQFLVVNHSPAEFADLAANVSLIPLTGRPEQQPTGTFTFKLPSLGPYESKELKSALQTHLRAYELPDWQFLRAELQITSP